MAERGSRMSTVMKLATGSILLGLLVLALKTLAWRLTGSVALMSDALESIVNVATAVAALVAIRVAQRPADDGHPYGHHKAEFFSAVLEGVLIIVAALVILHEAWEAFRAPRMIDAPGSGSCDQCRRGRTERDLVPGAAGAGAQVALAALVADGRHLLSDVVSSAGVLLGVALAMPRAGRCWTRCWRCWWG